MAELKDLLELLRCPHCGIDKPTLTAATHFASVKHDGHNPRHWRTYTCRNCGGAILAAAKLMNAPVIEMYPSAPIEQFEFENLPDEIAEDFREAMACYSIGKLNAFAAMSRRTVQSVSTFLGAKGSDKVLDQLKELKKWLRLTMKHLIFLSKSWLVGMMVHIHISLSLVLKELLFCSSF
jgi:hypothetical protein